MSTPSTLGTTLTLSDARLRLAAAQAADRGAMDAIAQSRRPEPRPSGQPRGPQISVQVATGAYTAQGAEDAYHDKRTGEWKARATGGRREQFGSHTLYDHNIGRHGEKLGRRKQETNLMITMNTNKRRFNQVQDMEAAREACETCFKKRAYDILEFGPRHANYKADADYPDDVIEALESVAVVEVGPKTGALHAHIWFKVTHWSQIQLHRLRLQHLFKMEFNKRCTPEARIAPHALPACMIELKPQSGFAAILDDYLVKQLTPLDVENARM